MSALSHLECTKCLRRYDADRLHNLCPACGKVLFARYDIDQARRTLTKASLANRPWDLWRYNELLPVREPEYRLTLGEGGTPLLEAVTLGGTLGFNRLLVKDEGRNPTGSFKARGLCAAVSRAVELGASDLALPTAGNAGAALAAYAARAGKTATVAMPVDTPKVIQAECRAHGARVLLVDGLINDAAKVIRVGAAAFGWFDVSTLKEPYRVEGKKTMGFELVEQLGWRIPDAIVFPTGGGTGIVGMWKAFAELEAAGLIDGKRPKMFVVQAEGCAPIARAFEEGKSVATPWQNAATLAPGIRVPVAIGDYLILQAIRESGGAAIAVNDDELLEAEDLTASLEGIFVSPESGAAVAGTRKLRLRGLLEPDELTVVFATGSGLMHTELIGESEHPIDPNTPNLLEAVEIAMKQEGVWLGSSQVLPAVGSGMRMDSG